MALARLPDHVVNRFDALLEAEIEALPPEIRRWLDEVPVFVQDEPGEEAAAFGTEALLGLHEGVPLTERGIEASGEMPGRILLYRRPILEQAGGGAGGRAGALRREIRITLRHEIGHHFGLDEEDLDRLGYG